MAAETLSPAETLWHANQELAQACLEHPFVQGLGDGSLFEARFQYYMGQDAYFLEAFMRAYCLGAAKAPTATIVRLLHELAGGVLAELKLHESYGATAAAPGAATQRYTDFLLATAWSQPLPVVIAAMLPCMKLYYFLGKSLAELSAAMNQPEHRYSDWIRTYNAPEFAALVETLADLAGETETLAVTNAYRYAMQCELAFFEAAWQS